MPHGLGLCCTTKLYVDEFYGATVIAFYEWWARVADWLDRRVWGGVVAGVAWVFGLWAQLSRFLDNNVVDGSFDKGCEELGDGRRPAGARAERPRADLPAIAGAGRGCAGRNSDLEQPGMNGIPILTLLTVLPLVGAVIALGRRQARARRGAVHDARAAWRWRLWCGPMSIPADGSYRSGRTARMGAVAGH